MTSQRESGCPGADLVDLVMATQGGAHRPIHAAGIGLEGTFVAAPDADKVSKAAVFAAGAATPVTVRFSDGVGHLGADQRDPDVRGFATRFHLDPDPAKCLDMIAMTLPGFFAKTPEGFEAFSRATVPSTVTGVPDADAVHEFVREHPTTGIALQWIGQNGIDVSYGAPSYFSVHAFRYVNAAGDTTVARFLWKPDRPQDQIPRGTNLSDESPDRLRREITARARAGDAPGFTLVLQVQGPGEAEDDPTIPWQSKNFVPMGHLQLAKLVDDQYWECEGMHFNPTRIVDGIELSSDQILHARGDAYHESATRRCMAYPAPSRLPTG